MDNSPDLTHRRELLIHEKQKRPGISEALEELFE